MAKRKNAVVEIVNLEMGEMTLKLDGNETKVPVFVPKGLFKKGRTRIEFLGFRIVPGVEAREPDEPEIG